MKVRNLFNKPPGPIAVFVGVAIVYIATGTYGGNQSRDTMTAAIASWALAVHHTVNLHFVPLAQENPSPIWVVSGAHGALVSNRFPGAVLLAAPFYAIAGAKYSPVPATLTAALAAAGACALLYKVLLRLQTRAVAFAGTLLFAFATSNWTVSGRELWEHPGAELVIAAGMLFALKRNWALSGLMFGAAILFRAHLGVGVAAMCIGIFWLERRWRPAITFAVAALPGLIGFLAWNRIVYGHFTIVGGYSDVGTSGVGPFSFLDNIAGTLVSPERGILICSPVLLLAAIGLRSAWRSSQKMERVFAMAGLAYLISQLWLIRYSGGDGFIGYRTCLESLLWAAPLLVRAGAEGVRRTGSVWAWILTAVSVAFFATGAFVQGETNGEVNPWTNWSPILIARQYGLDRVLLGAAIGLAGVFAAWGILRTRTGTQGGPAATNSDATDSSVERPRSDWDSVVPSQSVSCDVSAIL